MRRIVAPEKYIGTPTDRSPRIFLAGGITGAPEWQDQMAEMFKEDDLILFDPRRKNYAAVAREQIEWEFRHLHMADAISFWFPYPAQCMITLFELGSWLHQNFTPIFVGVDPRYIRREDIEIQLSMARPDLKIAQSLLELSDQVKKHLRGLG